MQFRFAHHPFAAALFACLLTAQQSPVKEPADLRVELRSTSGSNRFKLGEPIELEAIFSSKASGRYLEPCGLFGKPNIKPNFGFPLCRFFTRWSFTIKPANGWTDRPRVETWGGPTFEVPNRDLSSNPCGYYTHLTSNEGCEPTLQYLVLVQLNIRKLDAHPHVRLATSEDTERSEIYIAIDDVQSDLYTYRERVWHVQVATGDA